MIDSTRLAVRAMRRTGKGGVVINLASLIGLYPMAAAPVYAAAKAGLLGMTKALAAELAPAVRVNVLCPGPIDTPMLAGEFALAPDPDAARADENRRPPIGRIAQPGEIADAAVWLLAEARFATGAVVPIDGGTTAV